MEAKEKWDLFDSAEKLKGTFIRGQGMIPDGLYHKTVEVIPTDMHGTLLLTRRAMTKKMGAGQLEFPAGSVISGETEEEAAVRELQEETGLRPTKIFFLQKARAKGIFRYTYLACVPEMTSKTINCPSSEVMGYQFVTFDEWMALLTTDEYNGFRTRFYNENLFASVRKLSQKFAKVSNQKTKEHKPLTATTTLKPKHNRHRDEGVEDGKAGERHEFPDWEPPIEQGDDGT